MAMVGLARHIFAATVVFDPAKNERHAQVRCFGNSQLDLFALHFVMKLVVALAPAAELF